MKKLSEMTLNELRAEGKSLKIKGWWEMKKDELIVAIENETSETLKEEPDVVVKEEKENILKAVPEAQKRKNHKRLIEYKGETKTLTAWAKDLGIRHQTLYNRIVMKGMDPAEAFEMPTKKKVASDDK